MSETVIVKEEYHSDDAGKCQVKTETEKSPYHPQDISNDVKLSSQVYVKRDTGGLMIDRKDEAEYLAEVKAEPEYEWEINIEGKEINNDQESSLETQQLSSAALSSHEFILEKEKAGDGGVVRLNKEDDTGTDLQKKVETTAPNTAGDLLVPQMILIQDKLTNTENLRVDTESEVKLQSNNTATNNQQQYFCDFCGSTFETKLLVLEHEKSEHDYESYMCSQCDFKTVNKQTLKTHKAIHAAKKLFRCGQCNFKSKFKSTLLKHQSVHIGEKNWKCSYCDFKCSRKESVQSHERVHKDARLICDHCGFAAIQKGHLARHITTHASDQPFKCSNCDFKCSAKRVLTTHQRKHTGEKPFKCSYCEYSSRLKQNLQFHIMIHTGESPYKCSECGSAFRKKEHLQRHQRKHTDDKPFACDQCSYRCREKGNLKKHINMHTFEKPFKCSECSYSCNRKSNLGRHQLMHAKLKCEICDCKWTNKVDLLNHMATTHKNEKPYKCSHCDYASARERNVRRHQLRHTTREANDENTTLFGCDISSHTFNRKSDLPDHMTTHTGEKLFKCSYCDYASIRKRNLKRHELRHTTATASDTNTTLFGCDICSCKYKRKSDLQDHMKTHTGEKPIKCNHCDYASVIKKNLKRHELRHTTGEINYKNTNLFGCDICSCKYKRKSDLTYHMRIHTGENPFKCNHCDYATNIKTNLKEHELRHTIGETIGEITELFGCDICSCKYTWKTDLRKHMKIHSAEEPFKCNHCSYVTYVKKNLNKHGLIHGIIGTKEKDKNT